MNVLLLRWDTKPDKRIRRTFLRHGPTRRTSFYAAWVLGPLAEGTAAETVTVRRDSLAAILPLVEDQLLTDGGNDDIDMTELESALADLHTALSVPDTEPRGDA
jgi:hypothetical protein